MGVWKQENQSILNEKNSFVLLEKFVVDNLQPNDLKFHLDDDDAVFSIQMNFFSIKVIDQLNFFDFKTIFSYKNELIDCNSSNKRKQQNETFSLLNDEILKNFHLFEELTPTLP